MYEQMFKLRYLQFKVLEQREVKFCSSSRILIDSEVNKETKIAFDTKNCTELANEK